MGWFGANTDDVVGLDLRRAGQHRLERTVALGIDDAVEDQHERTGRNCSSQAVGEGVLRLSHEAVGLVPVEAPLDRHDALAWYATYVDREHRVASPVEGRLDVVDEQLAISLAAGKRREEHVQSSDGQIGASGDVVEHELDVGETQIRTAQQTDELPGADLSGPVVPVAGGGVGQGGREEAVPVVDTEGLGR